MVRFMWASVWCAKAKFSKFFNRPSLNFLLQGFKFWKSVPPQIGHERGLSIWVMRYMQATGKQSNRKTMTISRLGNSFGTALELHCRHLLP